MLLKSIQPIWIFFFYPFSKKETIKVPVIVNDQDKQFGLKLCNDDLMGQTYIEKLQPNSTMDKSFNKSTQDQLRGSFITHINGTPVFNTKGAECILQDLYTQYLQEQGVAADKLNSKSKTRSKSTTAEKSNFEFQITFAPERKLQGAKLKKAMDDFYGYAPGTTKTIKSKPDKLSYMKDVDA